jgi:multiple sugar transport system permease protein
LKRLFILVLIWAMVAFCLAPFVWQVITSFKTDQEIISVPAVYVPEKISFEHYRALFLRKPFARYLWNSFLISTVSTVICLAAASMAAYAFARLPFRGTKWLLGLLVLIALFPAIIFFFPLHEMVRAARLANHPAALIIP